MWKQKFKCSNSNPVLKELENVLSFDLLIKNHVYWFKVWIPNSQMDENAVGVTRILLKSKFFLISSSSFNS